MSVMAKELTDASNDLDETGVHQFDDRSGMGPDEPMGSSDMAQSSSPPANPNPAQQGRYAFGSGACPLDGYTIKRAVGRGGFGEVYYATSDSGKEVALKLILRNLDVERRGVIQCMNLKCPNLLAIYDLRDSEGGDTFVIMEYVAGPSLANVLKQHPGGLPHEEIRRWLKGLIDGVAYLHDHGVVHRDLKPANLFMEEGIVKIGDYGLAKLITASAGSGHSESIGTCHYMAPEIGSGKYHKPIDIYAMGVILYEMLTGRVPFEGETVNEVLMKHLTSRPDVSMLPEPYKAIVAKALAKDPNHRQRNIVDLLPPEDAPKQPEIRIIGDGKPETPVSPWRLANWAQPFRNRANPAEPAKVEPAKESVPDKDEDMLRIEGDEPVFYIGPDTLPPRRKMTVQERVQANWRALNRPRDFKGRRAQAERRPSAPQSQPIRQAVNRPEADVREQRIPELPPTPTGRLRVAELTTSMFLAAPLTALFMIPASAALNLDLNLNPQDNPHAAFLFGLSLLSIWTVLILNKWTEYRPTDRAKKLWFPLAAALLTASYAWGLGEMLGTGQPPSMLQAYYRLQTGPNTFGTFFATFAILFAISNGWAGLTSRDRPSRFRLKPVIYTTLLAALLYPLWPFRLPDELAAATILAVVVQLVSPWSEEAAHYAKFVRSQRKRRGKKYAA